MDRRDVFCYNEFSHCKWWSLDTICYHNIHNKDYIVLFKKSGRLIIYATLKGDKTPLSEHLDASVLADACTREIHPDRQCKKCLGLSLRFVREYKTGYAVVTAQCRKHSLVVVFSDGKAVVYNTSRFTPRFSIRLGLSPNDVFIAAHIESLYENLLCVWLLVQSGSIPPEYGACKYMHVFVNFEDQTMIHTDETNKVRYEGFEADHKWPGRFMSKCCRKIQELPSKKMIGLVQKCLLRQGLPMEITQFILQELGYMSLEKRIPVKTEETSRDKFRFETAIDKYACNTAERQRLLVHNSE